MGHSGYATLVYSINLVFLSYGESKIVDMTRKYCEWLRLCLLLRFGAPLCRDGPFAVLISAAVKFAFAILPHN